MSYFLLPNVSYSTNLYSSVSIKVIAKENVLPTINKTLAIYLTDIKTEIDNRQDDWDRFKKYTNPYEYIHTQISNTKMSVCKTKPLSRSYFKMIEMCGLFDLVKCLPVNCKSFHLAEGPGGFIEALCHLRQNPGDSYVGITLLDKNNNNVPGWKKSNVFLENNPNVYIETAADRTGNLMSLENLIYCQKKYKHGIDLVTADGGFDFSIDFNHQEAVSSKLILCQIIFAIAVQKKHGNFLIKFFDTFTSASIDMLYLLSIIYEDVYFVKPNSSRYANSEKYVVCKNFRLEDPETLVAQFAPIFDDINKEHNISEILSMRPPYLFVNKIEELNAIYGQQQLDSIACTLNLIDNNKTDKIENLKKHNIQKCINWCLKYNMPHNNSHMGNNIFLSKKPDTH
jgi:23S rRNA U2552 (ribose-2'-O)-methylase RlmE/FtsJ